MACKPHLGELIGDQAHSLRNVYKSCRCSNLIPHRSVDHGLDGGPDSSYLACHDASLIDAGVFCALACCAFEWITRFINPWATSPHFRDLLAQPCEA